MADNNNKDYSILFGDLEGIATTDVNVKTTHTVNEEPFVEPIPHSEEPVIPIAEPKIEEPKLKEPENDNIILENPKINEVPKVEPEIKLTVEPEKEPNVESVIPTVDKEDLTGISTTDVKIQTENNKKIIEDKDPTPVPLSEEKNIPQDKKVNPPVTNEDLSGIATTDVKIKTEPKKEPDPIIEAKPQSVEKVLKETTDASVSSIFAAIQNNNLNKNNNGLGTGFGIHAVGAKQDGASTLGAMGVGNVSYGNENVNAYMNLGAGRIKLTGNDSVSQNVNGFGVNAGIHGNVSERNGLYAEGSYAKISGISGKENMLPNEARESYQVGGGLTHKLNENTSLRGGYAHQFNKHIDGQESTTGKIVIGADTKISDRISISATGLINSHGNGASAGAVGLNYLNRRNDKTSSIDEIPEPIINSPKNKTNLYAESKKPEIKTPEVKITLSEKEMFGHNKFTLSEDGKMKLNKLAEQLKDPNLLASGKTIQQYLQENNLKIAVNGNTDATGSNKYNDNLAQKRADEVKTYLESKGIDSSIINSIGRGETNAKYNDSSIAEMKKNGLNRTQIHEKISSDRNVEVIIPGEHVLKTDKTYSTNVTVGGKLLEKDTIETHNNFAKKLGGNSNIDEITKEIFNKSISGQTFSATNVSALIAEQSAKKALEIQSDNISKLQLK